jgi:bacterioferritin
MLNKMLEHELNEIVQYLHSSFLVSGPGYRPVMALFREQAIESFTHAVKIGQKIRDLGGKPVVHIHQKLVPRRQPLVDMLRRSLEDEVRAAEGYRKILPLIRHDRDLYRAIHAIMKDEEDHVRQIENHFRIR